MRRMCEPEAGMLSHAIERGVLVVTVYDDPGIDGLADLVLDIEGLVRAYQPVLVVIVLEDWPPALRDSVSFSASTGHAMRWAYCCRW
ncbi:hypothetical protein SGLAM104S_09503 [Streptomyces glaucescens]